MNRRFLGFLVVIFTLALASAFSEETEHHRATHLGNLSTRFAPTLYTVADLRSRFADPKLQPDFGAVLKQWGWSGNLTDLFTAAVTNTVTEIQIPPGSTMPFMSSREGGHAICLRNVLWAGKLPISAFAFNFSSNGRRYRCVTPKPCSNFFIEDLGPEPKPLLALECSVPDKMPVGRKLKVCLTVRNHGDADETNVSATLLIPAGSGVAAVTENGIAQMTNVSWQIGTLAAGASRELCVTLTNQSIGTLVFDSTATGAQAKAVTSHCESAIFGIPAILLEKADDPDPVSVGNLTTYIVKVTNQGTADDANVQVVVTIAPELLPMTTSEGTITGQMVTLPLIPKLAAKQMVSYKITAKGVTAGDGHTLFTLTSDVLKSPLTAEESTTVY